MKKLGFKLFAIIALPFCFATLFLFTQPGAVWGQDFLPLGGTILGSPTCVPSAGAIEFRLEFICVVRGTGNNLHHVQFDFFEGSPTAFQQLRQRTLVSNPSCVNPANRVGRVICGVVGTDNALYGIRLSPPSAF
jgi:hypothetical protein